MQPLSHTSSLDAITPDALDRLARETPNRLLNLMAHITGNDSLHKLRTVLDMHLELVQTRGTPIMLGEPGQEFNSARMFGRLLHTPSHSGLLCEPWDASQHTFFEQLTQALAHHAQENDFVADLLVDGARNIQEAHFFQHFRQALALGQADKSDTIDGDARKNLLVIALIEGNAIGAIALMDSLPQKMVREAFSAIEKPSKTKGEMVSGIESLSSHQVKNLLQAMVKKVGEETVVQVRLELVQSHLSQMLYRAQDWKIDPLILLAGERGLDQEQSPLVAASHRHAAHLSILSPVARALTAALHTHCTPVLQALRPTLEAMSMTPDQSIDAMQKTVIQRAGKQDVFTWNAERFKESCRFLVTCGHDLQGATSHGNSMLHILASAPHNTRTLPKLVALLDLGLNAEVRNKVNLTAGESIADEEMRAQWEGIVASHRARTLARQLLHEFEIDSVGVVPRSPKISVC